MADAEKQKVTTKTKEPAMLRIRNCMKPRNAKIFTSAGVCFKGKEIEVPEAEAYKYIDKGIAIDAQQAAAADARKAARTDEPAGDGRSRA